MSIPQIYKADFFENEFYHVYNRTNNQEALFINDSDRNLFLHRFYLYLAPFVDTFAWNLLPNHFHFYIRIKSIVEINEYLERKLNKDLCRTEKRYLKQRTSLHSLIKNSFARFFISYSTCFNKIHARHGNLFHRPFRHIITKSENQFIQTIIYINTNAIKHKLARTIEDYKWSSYMIIISGNKTRLSKTELLKHFGGVSGFIKLHKDQSSFYYDENCYIDND
ncbi:MAG: hypothetical protein QM737_00575 [Ferruginibacter sp.]